MQHRNNIPKLHYIITSDIKGSKDGIVAKRFEISNHLGNVLSTFTDSKYEIQTSGSVTGYKTYIASSQDYYPFGMQMPDRGKNPVSGAYRFVFNGKEKDKETYGEGNEYDFGARIYNPRIGRWLSVDPKASKYTFASPYNFCLNNPIIFIDPNGAEVIIHGKDAEAAKTELQKVTSLQISIDAKGKLSAIIPEIPIVLSNTDIALLNSINDDKIVVNLYTTNTEWYDSKDGSGSYPIMVGAFEGSEIKDGIVETTQILNINMAKKVEEVGLDNAGKITEHEIIESYIGGQDDPGGDYVTGYDNAHKKAESTEKNPPTNNMYQSKNTKTGVTEYGVENKEGTKRAKYTDSSTESKNKKFVKEDKK